MLFTIGAACQLVFFYSDNISLLFALAYNKLVLLLISLIASHYGYLTTSGMSEFPIIGIYFNNSRRLSHSHDLIN